jgi:hypothetical protein
VDWADGHALDDFKKIKPFFFVYAYILLFVIVIGVIFVLVYANTGGRPNFLHTSWEIVVYGSHDVAGIIPTCVIIAPVETLMFQVCIPKMLNISLSGVGAEGLSWGISQASFGLFHFSISHGDILTMVSAMMMGIVFLTLVKLSPMWGIGACAGAHAGWNLVVSYLQLSSLTTILGAG